MAAEVVSQLQTLVSRELSLFELVVVTFGKISGGRAHNVIADTCELFGMMWCFNTETDAFQQESRRAKRN